MGGAFPHSVARRASFPNPPSIATREVSRSCALRVFILARLPCPRGFPPFVSQPLQESKLPYLNRETNLDDDQNSSPAGGYLHADPASHLPIPRLDKSNPLNHESKFLNTANNRNDKSSGDGAIRAHSGRAGRYGVSLRNRTPRRQSNSAVH
jgi:hypothetical protein